MHGSTPEKWSCQSILDIAAESELWRVLSRKYIPFSTDGEPNLGRSPTWHAMQIDCVTPLATQ